MKKPLSWVAEKLQLGSETRGEITGWSIDSRTLRPGDLFFALHGPNHDGHAYIADVFGKGAVAAVVDREIANPAGPILRVTDTTQALQQLARAARDDWGGDITAVTGSAGKTTTKEVIAGMLAERFETAKNEGNLNNHIGLPLSLLRLPETARAAVIEMGMNHAGEIRALAEITHPQIGVVTNVGWAHIENFESIEGIALAKRELIESLGPSGIAVLNADDNRVAKFAEVHAGRTVFYGVSRPLPARRGSRAHTGGVHEPRPSGSGQADSTTVRAEDVRYSEDGTVFRIGNITFETALTGRHSVLNILAGVAVASTYGIAAAELTSVVRNLQPSKMRGERIRTHGILIYNDCYNSNPDAVRAMLDVLRDTPAQRRIAVLGEMLELGHWAERLHEEVGNYASESGVNVLVGIRGAACRMLDAAKRAGLHGGAAFFFDEPEEAGRLVGSMAQPGDAVLFKGSRGVHVEKALETFLATIEGKR